MVQSKHQVFINILGNSVNNRITFSQASWLGLVAAALFVGLLKGTPAWLAFWAAVLFSLPVCVWGIWLKRPLTDGFGSTYMSAWGLLSLSAMALGGGALSPLTVVLVLGPLACVTLGRFNIALHTAMIGLIAYVVAIIAGNMGWKEVAPTGWQDLVAPLAVAAVVQIVIFVWAIEPQVRAWAETHASPVGGRVSPKLAAQSIEAARRERSQSSLAGDLPVLLVHIAAVGRITRVEGHSNLRWPGLVPGEIAGKTLGPLEKDTFVCPAGKTFRLLKAQATEAGQWLALVPENPACSDLSSLEASLEDARAKARQAEQDLSERTTFFAGLGHDLKTPLNAILGFSDLMKAQVRGPLPEAYRDYPAIIHESGQDLMLLVDDILDLAKAEAKAHRLDLEPVDLVASGASVVRQLEDQAGRVGVKLALKESGEVWAEADARAVRQIWQNLVSNAIKYSNKGGTVTLSAGKAAGAVAISVRDRGAGMDQADLDRIAKPFAQGDNSKGRAGTGLGLAVVQTFAELHGGKVIIDTEKGKGTRVRVTLPALDVSRLQDLEDAAE